MKIDIFKDFAKLVNDDLLVYSENKSFIIKERNKKDSKYTQITLEGDGKVCVIKQDEKRDNEYRFPLDILKDFNTHKMCDFIVLHWGNAKKIELYFCELKSGAKVEQIELVKEQIKASKFFMKCLFQAIKDYHEVDLDDVDIDNAKNIIITPFTVKKTTQASKDRLFFKQCQDKEVIKIDKLIQLN